MRYARKRQQEEQLQRITLEQTKQDAEVMVHLAEVLDPFDRNEQARIMEAACVMLGEDDFASLFRTARLRSP